MNELTDQEVLELHDVYADIRILNYELQNLCITDKSIDKFKTYEDYIERCNQLWKISQQRNEKNLLYKSLVKKVCNRLGRMLTLFEIGEICSGRNY